MKSLSFIFDGQNYFDYLACTVNQGLKNLGHKVYSFTGHEENYCEPWVGQEFDFILQAWGEGNNFPDEKVPLIYLFGGDTGTDRTASHTPNINAINADVYFIRDLRDHSNAKCFPINFGIEDRYYCATKTIRKKLRQRNVDVLFLGQYDNCPQRRALLEETESLLSSFGYNVVFGGRAYNGADTYWSKWIHGHCSHDPQYFEALANAKIIFSPMGFGPDCARHWEAFASGGVPCIQYMPTIMAPPNLRDGLNCIRFNGPRDAVLMIHELLEDLDRAQVIADLAFETGKQYHTTTARARYMLDIMQRIGLLDNY